MTKRHTLGMGAVVAAAAFSLFALAANAQQPPAQPPATPGVAPVKPATAPATTAKAPAATTAKTADKKPAKAPSACKGLDETACKANPECGYIVPTKADAKTGKVDKPYCRKVAGVALKKPAAAKAPAATTTTKTTTSTTTTTKAPTTTAPATKQ